jgi:hypothetical protein
MKILRKANVNLSTFTCKIGNVKKGYTTHKIQKVPTFKILNPKGRIDEGNGWYSEGPVETTYDNYYLVLDQNEKPLYVITTVYNEGAKIKSDVFALQNNWSEPVKNFINALK